MALVKPDTIIFDLDNTFYRYGHSHRHAMAAVKTKLQQEHQLSPEKVEATYQEAQRILKNDLEGTASSHNRLLYFQLMFECLGMRTQPSLALACESAYWTAFLDNAVLLPGVHDCMMYLREHGVATGMLTNLTAQPQFHKLIHLGIDQYFDYVITSEEVGVEKPHQKGFHRLMEKFDHHPKSVWMVGDHLEHDIVAARNALNCTTVQVLHEGQRMDPAIKLRDDGAPDFHINDFSELETLFKRSCS